MWDILCRRSSANLLNLLRTKIVNIFWEQKCHRGVTGHWEILTHFTAQKAWTPFHHLSTIAPVTGALKLHKSGKGGAVPAPTTHCGGTAARQRRPNNQFATRRGATVKTELT